MLNTLLFSVASALRSVPKICYACAALLVFAVVTSFLIQTPNRSPRVTPPPSLVESVRAEISSVTTALDTANSHHVAETGLLTEIRDTLIELKDQGKSKRPRATEESDPQSAVSVQPAAPICLRSPAGIDVNITDLAAKATGRHTVEGMTYQEALVFNGFLAAEVAQLDDATSRAVYDGFKSSQPVKAVSRQPSAVSQPGRWSCSGGMCRRIR